MTICLLASVLCITAFAAEPTSDIVLRVSALKKDGTNVESENGGSADGKTRLVLSVGKPSDDINIFHNKTTKVFCNN